jgi:cell division protein FtsN
MHLVAVVMAVLAAFILGAAGGYVVKTLSLAAPAAAAQVVTGQPIVARPGSAWNYSNRRSGTQSVEGPAPTAAPSAPFREPATGRTGPQS